MSYSRHYPIIIAGTGLGGFKALTTLIKLLKRSHRSETILVINATNYFTFVPMLHEVATASVEAEHLTVPIREMLRGTPHRFLEATVQSIDPTTQTVTTSEGTFAYDYAIVGLGSGVNYFGTPGAAEFSCNVRTLSAAQHTEHVFLSLLEKERERVAVTIVGGGYTGVEVAGQFADWARGDLKRLYPRTTVSVTVVESNPRILNGLPEKIQTLVTRRLERMGVAIRTSAQVAEVKKEEVVLKDGAVIPTDMTVWSAGVGNVGPRFFAENLTEKGRLPVDEFLRHKQFPTLYVVGDLALGFNRGATTPFPPLGEVAYHEGQYAARHLAATLKEKASLRPFSFVSKGLLMPVGDWYGVAKIGPLIWQGRLAWWLRRTVYLMYMPRLSRKIRIAIDWTLHCLSVRSGNLFR